MTRRLPILLTALLAFIAWFPFPAQADLGRLFFTPEKRAQLTLARDRGTSDTALTPTDSLTLNGIVRSRSGRSTVWVDGSPQPPNTPAAGLQLTPAADATHVIAQPLSQSGPPLRLKVGERYTRPAP